ncbi:hypothetical protein JTB14_033695, partial [Gonioctena quinquepunctata]
SDEKRSIVSSTSWRAIHRRRSSPHGSSGRRRNTVGIAGFLISRSVSPHATVIPKMCSVQSSPRMSKLDDNFANEFEIKNAVHHLITSAKHHDIALVNLPKS